MNTNIVRLERSFHATKKIILAELDKCEKLIKTMSSEVKALAKQQDGLCTPEIAAQLRIPQVSKGCGSVELLNMLCWDIIPSLPPSGKGLRLRKPAMNSLVRIDSFFTESGVVTVGQLVQMSEQEILKFRKMGEQTVRLLKYCLSWNGLSLRTSLSQEIIEQLDNRVYKPIPEFFSDLLPDIQRERLYEMISRSEYTTVGQFLSLSRKRLTERAWGHSFDESFVDKIEAKLATIGRTLRPDSVE